MIIWKQVCSLLRTLPYKRGPFLPFNVLLNAFPRLLLTQPHLNLPRFSLFPLLGISSRCWPQPELMMTGIAHLQYSASNSLLILKVFAEVVQCGHLAHCLVPACCHLLYDIYQLWRLTCASPQTRKNQPTALLTFSAYTALRSRASYHFTCVSLQFP